MEEINEKAREIEERIERQRRVIQGHEFDHLTSRLEEQATRITNLERLVSTLARRADRQDDKYWYLNEKHENHAHNNERHTGA